MAVFQFNAYTHIAYGFVTKRKTHMSQWFKCRLFCFGMTQAGNRFLLPIVECDSPIWDGQKEVILLKNFR